MKAVIYSRVSTADQDTARQVAEIQAYAANKGIEILNVYSDNITGTSKQQDRPAFEAMINFIDSNAVKLVIVHELSRLGRNLRNTLNISADFKAKGINIFFYTEGLYTITEDSNKLLNLNILSSIAEYTRTVIRANTMSGTANSIRKGGVGSGSIKQFGYKKENGKLVIDEDEAVIIREICDKYLNKGWGLTAIADYLNEQGVETRYKKLIDAGTIKYNLASKLVWTSGSIGRLLHKRLLTGYRVYGKVELQDEAFRIIDNDTFDALQVKMEGKRKTQANATKYENFLKGKMICGFCGGTMIMEKGKNGLANHYKCYNKFKIKEGCTSAKMINIDLLNNVVYDLTKDFQVNSAAVLSKISENNDKIIQNQNTLNQIEKDRQIELKKRSRLIDLYTAEDIDLLEYNAKKAEYDAKISVLAQKKTFTIVSNERLKEEINLLNSQKIVDLNNPLIFKENINNLIEKIEVTALSNIDIDVQNLLYEEQGLSIELPTSKRDILYRIWILMYDNTTTYEYVVNSMKNDIPKVITVVRK